MKKVIGIIVALLLLAYPAATWWTGKQVEAQMKEQYALIEQVPFVKVVKRDFQRGFASSTETVTFEVFGEMFRGLAQAQKEAAPGAQPPKPLQFSLRSRIKHGPFAGGSFAAAVADSELVFDEKTKAELAKVFGGKPPLTARTVFGFGGGGSAQVESPAVKTTIPGEDGQAATFIWDGIKANVNFTSGMRGYTMNGLAPKMEINDPKGARMIMSGMQFEGVQKRMFDDEPLLYSGTQKFKIAQIDLSGMDTPAAAAEGEEEGAPPAMVKGKPVSLKNVTYDIDIPAAGDFLDMSAKMGAASALVDGQDYGPVQYHLSFKHLHARTFAKLYRAMMKMYSDPALFSAKPDTGKVFATLSEPAMELLKYNPTFAIDRVSFKSPHGEAVVSGHVKLNDAKPEDFANMMMLIGKLDAGADLALPEAWLAEMSGAKAQSAEEKEMARQMFAAQLEAYSGQGYVTRAGGVLKSKIEFRKGELTVNGKAFDPGALRGAQQMPEEALADEPSLDEPAPAELNAQDRGQ